MKYTVKALSPVYKAYIGTIIKRIEQAPGVLPVSLEAEVQYDFIFTFEKGNAADITEITGQIKQVLRLYGSTMLAIDMQ